MAQHPEAAAAWFGATETLSPPRPYAQQLIGTDGTVRASLIHNNGR